MLIYYYRFTYRKESWGTFDKEAGKAPLKLLLFSLLQGDIIIRCKSIKNTANKRM